MADPTLLFCVGAQKAGTSWLYRYLREHPDCATRFPKELHYWDKLEEGAENGFRDRYAGQMDSLRKLLSRRPWLLLTAKGRESRQKLRDMDAWLKVRFDQPGGAHRDYLDFVFAAARPGDKVVADITPAYGLLDEARFAEMFRLTDDVRVIYILREPVERTWSGVRMMARMEAGHGGDPDRIAARATAMFRGFLRGKHQHASIRSDYARTLTALSRAVPEDRLLVLFYEELFRPETVRRITDFLGIAPRPAEYGRVVNSGQPIPLDPKLRARARKFLADQYAFVDRWFNGRIPARWSDPSLEA